MAYSVSDHFTAQTTTIALTSNALNFSNSHVKAAKFYLFINLLSFFFNSSDSDRSDNNPRGSRGRYHSNGAAEYG